MDIINQYPDISPYCIACGESWPSDCCTGAVHACVKKECHRQRFGICNDCWNEKFIGKNAKRKSAKGLAEKQSKELMTKTWDELGKLFCADIYDKTMVCCLSLMIMNKIVCSNFDRRHGFFLMTSRSKWNILMLPRS